MNCMELCVYVFLRLSIIHLANNLLVATFENAKIHRDEVSGVRVCVCVRQKETKRMSLGKNARSTMKDKKCSTESK